MNRKRRRSSEEKRSEAKRREEETAATLQEIPTLRPWYNYQQQQGDTEGRVEEGRDLRGSWAKKEGWKSGNDGST